MAILGHYLDFSRKIRPQYIFFLPGAYSIGLFCRTANLQEIKHQLSSDVEGRKTKHFHDGLLSDSVYQIHSQGLGLLWL